jgi:hypothetical protein
MEITRIKGADAKTVAEKVSKALEAKGYSNQSLVKSGTSVNISDIRLNRKYIEKYGRNISPFTGRRGNILGWLNWIEVNNTANEVLDKLKASANVYSLKGLFKIRKGTEKFTKEDWEELGYQNVGSIMNPVSRRDTWLPEHPERLKKKLGEII